MCNIVNTRFLRPFAVIMEITTKSPQKLYNGPFFGPFFLLKSPFFSIENFLTSSPQNKISYSQALQSYMLDGMDWIGKDLIYLSKYISIGPGKSISAIWPVLAQA